MDNNRLILKGVTTRPDNIAIPDGYSSLLLNAVYEDGVRPLEVPTPATEFTPAEGQTVIYIHEGNYIYYLEQDSCLCYRLSNGTSGRITELSSEPQWISHVGHTLVVSEGGRIFYCLLKVNQSYSYLGEKPPLANISFYLNGRMESYPNADGTTYDFTEGNHNTNKKAPISSADGSISWKTIAKEDDTVQAFCDNLTRNTFAKLNSFRAECDSSNKFIFPFLVRYAYRLYDGSVSWQSAPVLLIPNSCGPLIACGYTGLGDNTLIVGNIMATVCTLWMNVNESLNLAGWSDIVKSVEVYVSEPFYTYDQSGTIYGVRNLSATEWDYNAFCQGALSDNPYNYYETPFGDLIKNSSYISKFKDTYKKSLVIDLPQPKEDINKTIRNCSIFYKLCEIPVEQLVTTGRSFLQIEKNTLATLTAHETLPDDYNSHNSISANAFFAYNSRINIADITEQLYDGYPAASQQPAYGATAGGHEVEFTTRINHDGQNIIVKSPSGIIGSLPRYIFYPDVNAKTSSFIYNGQPYTAQLEEHTGLNGAVYFAGLNVTNPIPTSSGVPAVTDSVVSKPNKLYTSDAQNPFIFSLDNINTVGEAPISALSICTEAMSPGQFGVYPLYIFTQSGIWSAQVNSTGGWGSFAPINGETLIGSPCQLTEAVAFHSPRGILILSGKTCECITDNIKDDVSFSDFPGLSKYGKATGLPISSTALAPRYIPDAQQGGSTSLEYPQAIKAPRSSQLLAYDYAHRRLIVLADKEGEMSWIFSFNSNSWCQSTYYFGRPLNSYPTLMLSLSGALYKIDSANWRMPNYSYLLTRAFKFDTASYSTIRAILARSLATSIKMVLFGSRDYLRFRDIASSTTAHLRNISGSPFKSYCLYMAVQWFSSADKYITNTYSPNLANAILDYIDIAFQVKHTNKLR